MRWVTGNCLTVQDKKHVLDSFVHRFTMDHKPKWANRTMPNGKLPKVQFRSDQEWLNTTEFAVKNDGTLDFRFCYCRSTPTFPEGT